MPREWKLSRLLAELDKRTREPRDFVTHELSKEESYLLARKSLRLWPMKMPDIAHLEKYLMSYLAFTKHASRKLTPLGTYQSAAQRIREGEWSMNALCALRPYRTATSFSLAHQALPKVWARPGSVWKSRTTFTGF